MTEKSLDLLCIGRTSLDLFGDAIGMDFTVQRAFRAYVGGCPANICVAAHRLGLNSTILTGISDDYVGDLILRFLVSEGIDTSLVHIKPDTLTNVILAAVQPPGGLQSVAYHAENADQYIDQNDIDAAPIADSHALLLTGMGFLQSPSREAMLHAAHIAREAGVTVFMDADYRPEMWPSADVYRQAVRPVIPLLDYLLGTEAELSALAKEVDARQAAAMLRDQIQEAVVLKRGSLGSQVFQVGVEPKNVPPFPVRAINMMGAGDAFAAGFIYGWRRGGSLASAARLGNACGAILVAQHGTANNMPTLESVLDFIDAHGGF